MSAIVDQHLETLKANPADARAFDALEELFFMAGEWDELVSIYELRLGAPEFNESPEAAVPVLFRMAQVLEDRCLDPDRAIPVYWQVAKLDTSHRPAMRQLRQIHASRSQWDMVLQIAEMESQLPMEPHERATFLSELGDIWLKRLEDTAESRSCYERALGQAPEHAGALTGLAVVEEKDGRHQEAADTWKRLSMRLRGPDRAPVLVNLGKLLAGPLSDPAAAAEAYRRALTDDPRSAPAVEGLAAAAQKLEDWNLLADLYVRRFDLASGARARTAIAVEAGRFNLEKLDNTQAARMWFDRARELADDDPTVYIGIAELEGRTGDRDARAQAQARVIELTGDSAPASTLLEAAEFRSGQGDNEGALELLRKAQARAPQDPAVIAALSETLSQLGLMSELIAALDQRVALSSDPDERVELLARMGEIHESDLGDADAALECLSQAFTGRPDQPGVAASLERLHRKQENWNALHALLVRASQEGPENERAGYWASLGTLTIQHLGDVEAAGRAFEAALAIDPDCPEAMQGLEDVAISSGDEEAILRAYQREAATTTDRSRLAYLVGELVPLLEARERFEDAIVWLEKLSQLVPEDRSALERLAGLREALGRDDDLQDALRRLDPLLSGEEQAANRRRLAELHTRHERIPEAIDCYRNAIECHANDIESLRSLKILYGQQRNFEQLARTMRQLADALPAPESTSTLVELSHLLEGQLADIEGAIVVLWRLAKLPAGEQPADVSPRLESLLERAGRYEELAQQLIERRRGMPEGDPGALPLDLRRAQLLADHLGQYEEATTIFRAVLQSQPDEQSARRGLESALRAGNDSEGLAAFLDEQAERCGDRDERARLQLERAELLEDSLGAFDEALEAFEKLAARNDTPEIAEKAGTRLEELLSRCGDWEALRDRWEAKIGRGSGADDLALHEQLALLYRDRLNQGDGCIRHWEAAGRLAPKRAAIWHNLALMYAELERPADLLRVIEAELVTSPDADRECMLRTRAAKLCRELENRGDQASTHYERLLILQPGHPEASEFLIGFYEREDRPRDVVRLLEDRLEISTETDEGEATVGSQTSLRLRIAELWGNELDDLTTAIETLEPALETRGPCAIIAIPLSEFYQRAGRIDELIELCGGAAERAETPDERAQWSLRMGDCLHERGESVRAAEAYRDVLEARPNDLDAQSALRDIYRELGEAGPLADLLQQEIERRSGADRVPLQLELASLLTIELDRDEDALHCLESVLEQEPHHAAAFLGALTLNRKLDRHEQTARLLETALARAGSPLERAALLEQRGDLLAGPLDLASEAITHYRESLSLDPSRSSARGAMRSCLEKLRRWNEVLDCLFIEAQSVNQAERTAIYEEAVEIAERELSADAALPWLERLHAENLRDRDVLVRIANIHRQAGRHEALLRALDAQLEFTHDPRHQREIHTDRARIFERDLSSPGRALTALEAAREASPNDLDVLKSLDRLYEATARPRDRVDVIEARITSGGESQATLSELRRTAASIWSASLTEPNRAIPHLLHSISMTDRESGDMLPMLRELAENLRAVGRLDAWARAAELELELLEARRDEDDRIRRYEVHRELADCYSNVLSRSEAAQRHLLALLEIGAASQDLLLPGHAGVESILLERLRCDRNHVELERRMTAILERSEESEAGSWLELARLRDEVLRTPGGACAAYREVLKRDESCLAAIRGLRHNAEVLRDWTGVADSLDRELALEAAPENAERSNLLRRLGEVCWKRLDPPSHLDRAAAAFGEVLELHPEDIESVCSLEQIHEQQNDHARALALYEREVELLGEEDPERRQHAWLRAAELARDHTAEPGRALRAFEAADLACELPLERVREWAELLAAGEEFDRHVEIFARWCDAEGAPAGSGDHLALATTLHELGRGNEALARSVRAVELDAHNAAAWEKQAELQEEQGMKRKAAESLSEAAEIRGGAQGADLLLHAAHILEVGDAERSLELLRRAADHDSGSARVHAQHATVSEKLGHWQEAQTAAGHAIDLSNDAGALADSVRLETALAGGRAAWQREELDAAAGFYATALEIDSENIEGLESQGEVLFQCGDVSSARHVLEKRIALPTASDRLARQLTIIGTGFELEENTEEALSHFERALEAERDHDDAHEGIVRVLESNDRVGEAVEALEAWTSVQSDAERRADQLLRAAKLELSREARDGAEAKLRRAVDEDAGLAPAWVALADLLWELERVDDALESAEKGLESVAPEAEGARAALGLVLGRALDQRGKHREAADAFGEVLSVDEASSEAALGRARLLRKLGDWQEAANVLRSFLEGHPEPDDVRLAKVHYKLGRLLAGPLEQVEEAVACYERALELDPDYSKAREPLANLLAHLPDRWRDALKRHSEILEEDPFVKSSLRSVLRITQERGMSGPRESGMAILRALGIASPEEAAEAPAQLSVRLAETPELAGEVDVRVQRLAQHAAQEIAQALTSLGDEESSSSDQGPSFAPYRDFWDTMRGAEAELTAPGFESASEATIEKLMVHVAAVALDARLDSSDRELMRTLDRSIGRWARRKLRKSLDDVELSEVESLDWAGWRAQVRIKAACMALDRCEGDLRSALVTLSNESLGEDLEELSEATDITQRAQRDQLARELLGRVVRRWCSDTINAS